MLFRVMNSHQRCLQAKVKNRNEPKYIIYVYGWAGGWMDGQTDGCEMWSYQRDMYIT